MYQCHSEMPEVELSCPTQDYYTYTVTSELSVFLQTDSWFQPVLQHDAWKWAGPSWDTVSSKRQIQTLTVPELSLLPRETHGHCCLGVTASSLTELSLLFRLSLTLFLFFWYFYLKVFGGNVHHAVLCQMWVCGVPSWEDQLHWPGNA